MHIQTLLSKTVSNFYTLTSVNLAVNQKPVLNEYHEKFLICYRLAISIHANKLPNHNHVASGAKQAKLSDHLIGNRSMHLSLTLRLRLIFYRFRKLSYKSTCLWLSKYISNKISVNEIHNESFHVNFDTNPLWRPYSENNKQRG